MGKYKVITWNYISLSLLRRRRLLLGECGGGLLRRSILRRFSDLAENGWDENDMSAPPTLLMFFIVKLRVIMVNTFYVELTFLSGFAAYLVILLAPEPEPELSGQGTL